MSVSPKAKRKKEMTRKEVMEKLKQNENDISKAVQGLLEELCPFDVNDEEALKIEGRLERLQKASHIFECKLWRLKKQIKERKFRHNPELLDEKIISSSQFWQAGVRDTVPTIGLPKGGHTSFSTVAPLVLQYHATL